MFCYFDEESEGNGVRKIQQILTSNKIRCYGDWVITRSKESRAYASCIFHFQILLILSCKDN